MRPSALIVFLVLPRSFPTAAIRPLAIATSPMNAGFPVPSTILPPRINTSCMGYPPSSFLIRDTIHSERANHTGLWGNVLEGRDRLRVNAEAFSNQLHTKSHEVTPTPV